MGDRPLKGIRSWAEDDRPREKLLLKGRASLSDAELIAILIGSGNAEETAVDLSKRILKESGNSLADLAKLSVSELMRFKGIGEAKAISIIAALELGRRRRDADPARRPQVTSSRIAYELMLPMLEDLRHEEFFAMYLDTGHRLMGIENVSRGGANQTLVDAKVVFKLALRHHATFIILAHNHPSGRLAPSNEDIRLTKKLSQAGRALDIIVRDHLIIGEGGYYSFADSRALE